MPEELVDLAEINGYGQVSNFYTEIPGVSEPPYVYGYVKNAPKEFSVAFWSQKKSENESDKTNYYLIFATHAKYPGRLSIVTVVPSDNPAGLSLFEDTSLTMDKLLYTSDYKTHGPKDVGLKDYGVKSYYDGNADIYFLHDGKSLVLFQWDQ